MKTILFNGKSLIIATGISLMFASMLIAQPTTIKYGNSEFDGVSRIMTYCDVPKVEKENLEKKWSSRLKDMDGKLRSNKGEMFLDNTEMKSVSPDTLDLYSRVESGSDHSRIVLAVNKNGEFINNATGSYPEIDKLLYDFVNSYLKNIATDEYDAAEKILKGMEHDLKELKEKNKKMAENNEEMKNKISDNERSIKSNEKSIDEINEKIKDQDGEVKTLKSKVDEFK